MSLQELKSKLDQIAKGRSTLVVDETDLDSAEFRQILGNLPGRQLTIQEPAVSDIHDDAFTVSGRYSDAWIVTGIPPRHFAIDDITLTLSESNGRADFTCRLTGTVGASRLPVEITMSPEGGWQAALYNDEGGDPPSFGSLLSLASGGVGIDGLVPLLENDAFKAVSVVRFEIQFDGHQTAPTYINLMVTLNRPWDVMPGLVAVEKDFSAEFYSMHAPVSGDLALTSIGGIINGSIALGAQAYDMTISLNDAEKWEIRIKPDNGFPELADLASLAGGDGLKQLVHGSLSAWGFEGFVISAIAIGFDPVEKAIDYVSVDGRLTIAQAVLDISVGLPEFGLSGRLAKGNLLHLGQLLERFAIPVGSLADLTVSDLFLSADPNNSSYILQVRIDEALPFAPIPGIPALTMQDVALQLAIDPAGGNSGLFSGLYSIAGVEVELTGRLDDVFELSGTIGRLGLTDLFSALLKKTAPPVDLPDVEFSDLQFSLTPATGALALNGSASGRWYFPAAESGMVVTRVDFALNRTVSEATAATACQITIRGDEPGAIADGLAVNSFSLTFNLDRGNKWSLAGDIHAALFDADISLKAGYAQTAGTKVVRLSADYSEPLNVVDLEGIATLSISDMAVEIGKTVGGGQTASTFDLVANGRIAVDHAFDFNGLLQLYHQNDGVSGLAFKPDSAVATISLPVGIPEHSNPLITIEVDEFRIGRGVSQSGTGKDWIFEASADMQLQNIPQVVQSVFPEEKLNGSFYADRQTVVLRTDLPSTLQPQFPELALKFANNYQLSLGRPGMSVTRIELHLGDEPELVEQLHVTLPGSLNYLFGGRPDGTPNQVLFNASFDLSLSMGRRLRLYPITSPLKPLEFYEEHGKTWTDWNFGALGRYSFQVPEFSLDKGRWQASVGFQRRTEIAIPLTPLKFALRESGISEAFLSILPDAIPIRGVDLRKDGFYDWVKDTLGDDVLGRIDPNAADILKGLADIMQTGMERLPAKMQEYFDLKIPESALLDMVVDSVGGGTQVGFRILDDDPPLKLLFPMMLGFPEIVGVTIRGFSFGQKASGGLIQLELDGHVDRFDMLSLTAALATGGGEQLSNRYIFDRMQALIPSGLPVLVPLFYNHLGFEYRDLLGLEMQAHWHFPDPEPGLPDYLLLINSLVDFLTDPAYLLHEKGLPDGLRPILTIGENYLRLPAFLGGQTVGPTEALPALDAGDSVARFLDFLKTGNAGYAITAIPLRHEDTWIRIGSREIHFGPLVIGMSWCITTDEEFVDVLLPASKQHDNLPLSFDEAVLESLPTEGGEDSYQKGFIILLMGNVDLGRLVGLRTEFGIAVTAKGGFETGFRMAGEIGRTLSLAISGKIQAIEERVTVKGSTGLYWNDQALITASGRITVGDTALEVEIKIELTPFFCVEGLLVIGKQGLSMDGRAAWGHGADGPQQGIGASVAFSRDGMTICFEMRLIGFDAQVTVRVPGDGDNSLFAAAVAIKPDVAMQESFARDLTSLAKSISESSVDQVYNDLQNVISEVESLEISVAGLREWLPPLCDRIIASITRTMNDNTNGWKRPGRAPAHKKAKPYIQRLTTLRNVSKSASNRDFRPRLQAALLDIVNHNHLNVTVGIPAVRWKKNRLGIPYPVYYTKQVSVYRQDLMDDRQLADLREAIGWVDALPGKEDLKIETQEIYDRLPDRDKLLSQIGRGIEQGVEGALPQVESIAFHTSLELLDLSDLEVTVCYRHGGKQLTAKTTLDLTNPDKSTQQLIDAFGSG